MMQRMTTWTTSQKSWKRFHKAKIQNRRYHHFQLRIKAVFQIIEVSIIFL